MTRFVLLTALAVAALAARAYADPIVVHSGGCPSLDAGALAAAIDRELSLDDAPHEARTIDVACPDPLHANLSLSPGGWSRELDLSDEPAGLRIKLVALAVAELVDASRRDVVPPAVVLAPVIDTEDVPPIVLAHAPAILAPPRITMRAGLRLVVGDADPMPTLSADLDLGVARVGLTAALGDGHRDEGSPFFLGVTLARALACAHRQTSVCLVARGEAGFEGEAQHRHDDMDPTVHGGTWAAYADLSLGFEVRRRIAGWSWVAAVDLGAGDGLLFEAATLERFDGPFVATTLGASW